VDLEKAFEKPSFLLHPPHGRWIDLWLRVLKKVPEIPFLF
jgi:hypothetical protein